MRPASIVGRRRLGFLISLLGGTSNIGHLATAAREAMERGHGIAVLSASDESTELFLQLIGSDELKNECEITRLGPLCSFLLRRRKSRRFLEVLLRSAFFLWLFPMRNTSVVVAGSDTDDIEYFLGFRRPLIVLQATVDHYDLATALRVRTYRTQPEQRSPMEVLLLRLDRASGGRLLRRIDGRVAHFAPSLAAAHALFGRWPVPSVRGTGSSAAVCLGGPRYVDHYQRLGVDRNKLHPTGLLDHDDYRKEAAGWSVEKQTALLNELGLCPHAKIVVVFLSAKRVLGKFAHELEEVGVIGRLTREALPDHTIVMKHHPRFGDGEAGYRQVDDAMKSLSNTVILRGHEGFRMNQKLIVGADLVVAPGTMGIAARLAHKPLLTYDLRGGQHDEIARTLQLSRHVTSVEQYRGALEAFAAEGALTVNEDFDETRLEEFFLTDGKGASRLVDLAETLAARPGI